MRHVKKAKRTQPTFKIGFINGSKSLDIDRKKKFQVNNLNEWLDQPEVSAAHPPLQVEHGEGHAVRGERGVPGDETQSRVVQSPLHSAQLYNCHVHLFSSIKMSFAQHKACSLCKRESNFFSWFAIH